MDRLDSSRCPTCGVPVQVGITTEYDERLDTEVCLVCRAVVSKSDDYGLF